MHIRLPFRVLVIAGLAALASGQHAVSGLERTPPGQASTKTVWDQVYTEEQATRGRRSYETQCESCHLENLRGDGYAPALGGLDFSVAWTGRTVGDLFDSIATTMPQEEPGSLTAQVYIDIVAYLLQKNHIAAGDAELLPDAERLQQISITEKREG